MIELWALDNDLPLLQLDRVTPIMDRQEVGSVAVHPYPSGADDLAAYHLADKSDLLVDPADELLAALNVGVSFRGTGGGRKRQFHGCISLR